MLYIVYWFIYEQEFMMYEYLLVKFPGFDGQSFSNLVIFSNVVNMIALLIFVPILAARFHDSLILIIGLLLSCIGLVIKPFAQKIWHIYIGQVSILPTQLILSRSTEYNTTCPPRFSDHSPSLIIINFHITLGIYAPFLQCFCIVQIYDKPMH